jgi:UDP-N-acetylglucosamine 4-epimerase
VNALFELLREITGVDVEPRYVEARAGEVRHSQADISRATRELGYRPAVSLREGLELTTDYYRERRAGDPGAALPR